MKVGDTVKIDFAGKKKDGVVFKLHPNSVHLKVDFDGHKGKIVKRKLNAIGKKKTAKKAATKAKKKETAKPAK